MDKEAAKADWGEIWQAKRKTERVDRNILKLNKEMHELLMGLSPNAPL